MTTISAVLTLTIWRRWQQSNPWSFSAVRFWLVLPRKTKKLEITFGSTLFLISKIRIHEALFPWFLSTPRVGGIRRDCTMFPVLTESHLEVYPDSMMQHSLKRKLERWLRRDSTWHNEGPAFGTVAFWNSRAGLNDVQYHPRRICLRSPRNTSESEIG